MAALFEGEEEEEEGGEQKEKMDGVVDFMDDSEGDGEGEGRGEEEVNSKKELDRIGEGKQFALPSRLIQVFFFFLLPLFLSLFLPFFSSLPPSPFISLTPLLPLFPPPPPLRPTLLSRLKTDL